MISKRINCAPANDNYARLAKYIAGHGQEKNHVREYCPEPYFGENGELAQKRLRELSECDLVHRTLGEEKASESILSLDARGDHQSDGGMRWNDDNHRPEKCFMSWTAGCWSEDDYELAMQEVMDTQALNTRTTKEKTYHLLVSFRPEDQDKLTPENFKEIEKRFAEVLGLSEHQRLCGVHVNTDNTHMHVAYNLIHPENLTRVEPWRDYVKRDKLCRELEKEFGLMVDNGRDKTKKERGLGEKSATVEAHTGCQSFESYAREHGNAILSDLASASSWEDAHAVFARHGLEVKPRGAGLIVKNRHGKQTAKASSVHRDLSLKKMVARFGAFQAAKEPLPDSLSRYGVKPIQKAADKNRLWNEFQIQTRAEKAKITEIRKKWDEKRKELVQRAIARKTRAKMMKLLNQHEAREIYAARLQEKAANWISFLQKAANGGDENALAILRSRHEEIQPENTRKIQKQAAYMASKTSILENTSLPGKIRTKLLGMALMDKIADGATARISSHGSIIYSLPNGGKINDTGKSISFSDGARETALAYMAAKWGVRRHSVDRETSNAVFILSSGQRVVLEAGKNILERPSVRPRVQERTRSGISR